MLGIFIQRNHFQNLVSPIEDGAAGRLIDAAVLHAHQAVLHDVQKADAVVAAQLVELADDIAGLHRLAVNGGRHTLDEIQGHVSGRVGSRGGGDAHLQKAGLVVLRLVGRVLQIQALVAQVPQVLVLGVVGFTADLQGDIVGLGIVDLLIAALDIPLPPRGDDGHFGGEALDSQLEADLVIALAGAAVGDGVRALLLGDVHQALADDGAGEGSAQEIVLVLRPHHHGGDDHVVHHFVNQVLDVQLRCAGLDGLLLQTLQLVALAHVCGDGDDLGVVVVLLQPGNDDGRIQAAGIGQHDFFDLFLAHDVCPPDDGMILM